jgi:16S rRNA (guanine527-N7)-methyltransferase
MPELPPPDPLPLVRAFLSELPVATIERFGRFTALVRTWNERLNLVSRKDIEHLEEHHLLHSLLVTKVLRPAAGAHLADLGTGGGFPGLPLAIVFPEAKFTLVDSIAKKARAVDDMAAALELRNVRVLTERAEKIRDRFDYVLGRAVTALPEFLRWSSPLLRPGTKGSLANGVLYFKGTLWREELAGSATRPDFVWTLGDLVPRPYFTEKFLLHFSAPIRRPAPAVNTR